jgi:hypothetical protein
VVSISACHLAETIRRRPGFDSPSESDLCFFLPSCRPCGGDGGGPGARGNVSNVPRRITRILFAAIQVGPLASVAVY